MSVLMLVLPPELRTIGGQGEDHDEGGEVQGGREGGAALPGEEHRRRPLTLLLGLWREKRGVRAVGKCQ